MPHSVPYDDLDPGIRQVVRWLTEQGFSTCDSGDGRSKFDADGTPLPGWESEADYDCIIPEPHVFMSAPTPELVTECDRLQALLMGRGIEVGQVGPEECGWVFIQGTYDPAVAEAHLMLIGLDDARLALDTETLSKADYP